MNLPNQNDRLHLVAPEVLTRATQRPEPWQGEYEEWLAPLLGPMPPRAMGKRGYENWNMVALGALLAWGYFAEMLKEGVADPEPATPALGDPEQLDLPFTTPEDFAEGSAK